MMREVAFEKKRIVTVSQLNLKPAFLWNVVDVSCGFPPNLFLADATNHHHPLELVLANNSKSFQLIPNKALLLFLQNQVLPTFSYTKKTPKKGEKDQ